MLNLRTLLVALAAAGLLLFAAGHARSTTPAEARTDHNCTAPSSVVPAVVTGNVIVHPGAFCIAFVSAIDGNVIVLPDATGYHQHGGTINGNVQADQPRLDIRILDVEHVGGDIQITGTKTGTAGGICRSQINGDIQLANNAGLINVGIGFPFDVCFAGNTIGGDVQIENNSGTFTVNANQIGGDLQYFENIGASGAIIANQIAGNLQCEKNAPPPVSAGNTAKSKEGQCLS